MPRNHLSILPGNRGNTFTERPSTGNTFKKGTLPAPVNRGEQPSSSNQTFNSSTTYSNGYPVEGGSTSNRIDPDKIAAAREEAQRIKNEAEANRRKTNEKKIAADAINKQKERDEEKPKVDSTHPLTPPNTSKTPISYFDQQRLRPEVKTETEAAATTSSTEEEPLETNGSDDLSNVVTYVDTRTGEIKQRFTPGSRHYYQPPTAKTRTDATGNPNPHETDPLDDMLREEQDYLRDKQEAVAEGRELEQEIHQEGAPEEPYVPPTFDPDSYGDVDWRPETERAEAGTVPSPENFVNEDTSQTFPTHGSINYRISRAAYEQYKEDHPDWTDAEIKSNYWDQHYTETRRVDPRIKNEENLHEKHKTGDYRPEPDINTTKVRPVDEGSDTAGEAAKQAVITGYINVEGDYVNPFEMEETEETDENGETHKVWTESKRMSNHGHRDRERAVQLLNEHFGGGWAMADRIVRMRLGWFLDTNELMELHDKNKRELPVDYYVKAADDAIRSQKIYGTPFGLIPGERLPNLSQTRCFPIGIIPRFMAQELCRNSPHLKGTDPAELVAKSAKHFREEVLPRIVNDAHERGNKSQLYALEAAVRGISSIDGIDPSVFGVREQVARDFDTIMQDNKLEMNAVRDPEMKRILKRKEINMVDLRRRVMRMHGRRESTDSNGVTNFSSPSFLYRAPQTLASIAKMNGVFGNFPVIMSNYLLEKPTGNFLHWALNLALQGSFRFVHNASYKKVGDNYMMTKTLYDLCNTDEAAEAWEVASNIATAGNMDTLILYLNEGGKLRNEDARKWLAELDGRADKPSKVGEVTRRFLDSYDKIMSAEYGFRRQNAKRFMQAYVTNQMRLYSQGQPSMTTHQLEEAMTRDPTETFEKILGTFSGRQALLTVNNLTMGRLDPWSAWVNEFLRKHGITNFLVTMGFETYITYGIRLAEVFFPFSNTFSWLASRAIIRPSRDIKTPFMTTTGENKILKTDKNYLLENQMDQFLLCVAYDMAKLGGTVLQVSFLLFVFTQVMGVDPPDEPEKRNHYDEWKIGGRPIRLNWYLSDWLGVPWSIAAGAAIYAEHGDVQTALNCALDGIHDQVSGTVVMDAVNAIKNAKAELMNFADAGLNPETYFKNKYGESVNTESLSYRYMYTAIATGLEKLATPAFLRFLNDQFIVNDKYARTAGMKYNPDNPNAVEENDLIPIDENDPEYIARSLAKNHVLFGILADIFGNGLMGNGTTTTGFTYYEQPISMKTNDVHEYWDKRLDMNNNVYGVPDDPQPNNNNLEEYTAWRMRKGEEAWNWMVTTFGSPERARANMFYIPYERRQAMIDYLHLTPTYMWEDWCTKSENDEWVDNDQKWEAYRRIKAVEKQYTDASYDWLQNDIIPWSKQTEKRLNTSTQAYYMNKETGEEFANPFLADIHGLVNDPRDVEVKYENYGDRKNSFTPFLSPEGEGYDYRAIQPEYNPDLTDYKLMLDLYSGAVIEGGMNDGKSLLETMFGIEYDENGTLNLVNSAPVIANRGYEPTEVPLPEELRKRSMEDSQKDAGIDPDKLKDRIDDILNSKSKKSGWVNYGRRGFYNYSRRSYYRGGRYSGGGSSNYNPKIYSNTPNVNADRAASMYLKQPYGATVTYLRPQFSTKGSREAYRRQDL